LALASFYSIFQFPRNEVVKNAFLKPKNGIWGKNSFDKS
jgi:hypothetical protein